MPNDESAEQLDWTEENLNTVIADVYHQADTDREFYDQLMANPHEVLSRRIKIPEEYVGRIFARERNKKTLILSVPAFGAASTGLPEGTTEAGQRPDYEIICTVLPIW